MVLSSLDVQRLAHFGVQQEPVQPLPLHPDAPVFYRSFVDERWRQLHPRQPFLKECLTSTYFVRLSGAIRVHDAFGCRLLGLGKQCRQRSPEKIAEKARFNDSRSV